MEETMTRFKCIKCLWHGTTDSDPRGWTCPKCGERYDMEETMSEPERGMCAHLNIKYDPEHLPNGLKRDRWTCDNCSGTWNLFAMTAAESRVQELEVYHRDAAQEIESLREQLERAVSMLREVRDSGGRLESVLELWQANRRYVTVPHEETMAKLDALLAEIPQGEK